MDTTPTDPSCSAVRDELAALATGTLTGRERAVVAAHLDLCTDCSPELELLAATVDTLMALVPEVEPPDGFAARTTALLPLEPRSARPPARWRVAAVAAAVAALAVGVAIGAVAGGGGGGGGGGVRTAALSSPVGATGTVVVSAGRPAWLFMRIDDKAGWGTATCRITLADGSKRIVGRFALAAGYRSWVVDLAVPASAVRDVAVVGADGTTIASARLGT